MPDADISNAAITVSTLAVLIVCVLMRGTVLASNGAPATIDAGNWLAFGHGIFGAGVRSGSIVYPPVVPIMTVGAVSLLGAMAGVAILGAVASIAPALAVFTTLRLARVGWASLPLAALAATAGSVGEAAAWGGFPQLFGLATMLAALWFFDEWLLKGSWRMAIVAGFAILLVGATSDIVFGALAVSLVVLACLRALFSTNLITRGRELVRTSPLIVLILIPLIPLYVRLGVAVHDSMQTRRLGETLSWADIPSRLEFLYRDLAWPWRISVAVALLTPLLLFHRRTNRLWLILTSIIVTVLLTAVALREVRFLYLLPIACLLSLGIWVRELDENSAKGHRGAYRCLVGAISLFALVQLAVSVNTFRDQREYYGILNPGLVRSIEWVREHSATGTLVAIPSIRSAPAGWWVEGLGERQTLSATPLRWLNFADERRRARIANRIFSEEFPNGATLHRARRAHVAYLIVPLSSEIIDSQRFHEWVRTHGSRVAFRSANSYVVRI